MNPAFPARLPFFFKLCCCATAVFSPDHEFFVPLKSKRECVTDNVIMKLLNGFHFICTFCFWYSIIWLPYSAILSHSSTAVASCRAAAVPLISSLKNWLRSSRAGQKVPQQLCKLLVQWGPWQFHPSISFWCCCIAGMAREAGHCCPMRSAS